MITTTSHFQVRPDYYDNPESCKEFKQINTNKRYKYFCQTHFTAGDTEQFEEYRDKTNGENKDIKLNNNIWSNYTQNIYWEKYKNLSNEAVDNTFRYLFYKFKKAIFVKIKNRKLSVFLPFSNKNFVNEWHSKIQVQGKMSDFIAEIQKREGRKFHPKSLNKYTDTWFANNCLVRWEYPINEGDTNIACTSDFFHTLCRERDIPDIEFFVNRRDFPLLKTNSTEAYDHLFGDHTPLLSHNYKEYSPILSMVGKNDYADIPIPTSEDWARVARNENKYFPKTEDRDYTVYNIFWEEKKDIAVFRGSCTGAGVTIDTNPRLKLSFLGSLEKNKNFLDAGITEWNLRPRKLKNHTYLQTINIDKMPFPLKPVMSMKQQQEYKYVINVDGHVSAYRLSMELSCGFCILLAPSKYKLWFFDLLEANVHYIPIKADLSDLIEKIKWCRRNDKFCKQIGENAKNFANKYLSKDGILDYTQKLLFDLKNLTGTYLYPKNNKLENQEFMRNLIANNHTFQIDSSLLSKINTNNIQTLFENDNTKITRFEKYCFKKSKTDLINQAFMTLNGTNKLCEDIPNFCKTYYYDNKENILVTEYIRGENLYEYIHSDNFCFEEYIKILYICSLSIYVAQKKMRFIHWDLTPWNIILKREEKEVEIDYVISENKIYSIKTKIIPVIIDMGRSGMIYNNKSYGGIKEKFSTIQDILTLLNISIFEIANFDTDIKSVNNLIRLANFISLSSYRKKPFFRSGDNGLGEIRFFFRRAKKFSELIESDKYELEKLTPLDFITYLERQFKIDKHLKKTIKTSLTKIYYHPLENNSEISSSNFLQILNRVFSEHKEIKDNERLFLFYKLETIIDRVYKIANKYTEKYKRCKKYIRNAIKNSIIEDNINLYDREKISLIKNNKNSNYIPCDLDLYN
jgi:hypothetical protein